MVQVARPANCSTADWECYRFSSYLYPSSPLSNSAAAAYDADDFEVLAKWTTRAHGGWGRNLSRKRLVAVIDHEKSMPARLEEQKRIEGLLRGEVLYDLGRFQEAEEHCRKARELAPDESQALFFQAVDHRFGKLVAVPAAGAFVCKPPKLGDGIYANIDEAISAARRAFLVYRDMGLEKRRVIVGAIRSAAGRSVPSPAFG